MHSATELWQAHHDRLVQENVEARQHSEEQLRSISAGFEQSQGALLVDLAEARSALAAQTQQIQRLQAAQACLAPHNTRLWILKGDTVNFCQQHAAKCPCVLGVLQDEAAKQVAAAQQAAAAAQQSCVDATAASKVSPIDSLGSAHNAQGLVLRQSNYHHDLRYGQLKRFSP